MKRRLTCISVVIVITTKLQILLCFLAGNDFLPHLPWMFISMGHISDLLDIYYATTVRRGGHFIDGETGTINLRRVLQFLSDLRGYEEDQFARLMERISEEDGTRHEKRARLINAPKKVFSKELRRRSDQDTKELQEYFDEKLSNLKRKSNIENFPRNKTYPPEVLAREPGWMGEVSMIPATCAIVMVRIGPLIDSVLLGICIYSSTIQ